jgi:plastocyanin
MRRFTLLAVLCLAFAGCGGGDDEGGGGGAATSTPAAESTPEAASGGGERLQLAAPADGSLAFDKTELTAKAGTVTIDFDNPSSTPHAVEIEGGGVEEASETVSGGKASVTAELEPGEYTFYCPVGNHRDGGMEGTLTVE